MHDWQDEVLRFPEDIVPPAFMWRSGASGEESGLESRPSVIQSHYMQIREYLEKEGYADLTRMSDRLETRQSRLEGRVSTLESRLLYLRAQQRAFHDLYGEIKSALGSPESEASESPRETTLGEALLDEDHGLELSTRSAWKLDVGSDDGSKKVLHGAQIAYRPPDEEVDSDLQTLRTDFDSADVYRFDTLVFTGDRRWKEVFDQFEDRLAALGERKSKVRRTRDLLRFRRGIIETVLYQKEAFGSVAELTEEKAKEIASRSGSGRPTRLDDPEQVLEKLNAVCEWLDGDPPPHFKSKENGGGLANYVAGKFPMLSVGGARSYLMEVFPQLEREYPDLSVPSLESATDGRAYIKKADEIHRLRDEYRRRVVSKKGA